MCNFVAKHCRMGSDNPSNNKLPDKEKTHKIK